MSLTKTNIPFQNNTSIYYTCKAILFAIVPVAICEALLFASRCGKDSLDISAEVSALKNILQIVLKITNVKMFIIYFGEVLHAYQCINTFVYMTQAIKNLPTHHLRRKIKIDVAQTSAS
jgi:hypothetical protein